MKLPRPSRKKKYTTIAVGVLLIVFPAVGVYGWLSFNAWGEYANRLEGTKRQVTSLQQTATTDASAEARLNSIRELDDIASEQSQLCDMEVAYSWQASIIPAIKDGVERCQAGVKQLETAAKPLHSLRSYLDTSVGLQEVLRANLKMPKNLSEKQWRTEGLETATSLQAVIETVDAEEADAQALKDEAQGYADDLVKAWQSLLKAHAAKDKAAYLSASDGVTAAYTAFSGLADSVDEGVKEHVEVLGSLDTE